MEAAHESTLLVSTHFRWSLCIVSLLRLHCFAFSTENLDGPSGPLAMASYSRMGAGGGHVYVCCVCGLSWIWDGYLMTGLFNSDSCPPPLHSADALWFVRRDSLIMLLTPRSSHGNLQHVSRRAWSSKTVLNCGQQSRIRTYRYYHSNHANANRAVALAGSQAHPITTIPMVVASWKNCNSSNNDSDETAAAAAARRDANRKKTILVRNLSINCAACITLPSQTAADKKWILRKRRQRQQRWQIISYK